MEINEIYYGFKLLNIKVKKLEFYSSFFMLYVTFGQTCKTINEIPQELYV